VTSAYPDRCFASGQFGPLSIRPCHGACWAPRKHPVRLRATCHRTHGIRYFHGCYGIGDDQLRGVTREHKGGGHTLAALKSIRAARPGGYRLFVIMDNLAANKTPAIRRRASEYCCEQSRSTRPPRGQQTAGFVSNLIRWRISVQIMGQFNQCAVEHQQHAANKKVDYPGLPIVTITSKCLAEGISRGSECHYAEREYEAHHNPNRGAYHIDRAWLLASPDLDYYPSDSTPNKQKDADTSCSGAQHRGVRYWYG